MPQAVIPALITTSVGVVAAGGVAAFTFAGLAAGWGSVAAAIGTYTALGYASNALQPKPSTATARSSGTFGSSGYQVNSVTSSGITANIYGETRVGGVVFYQTTTSSTKYLHRVIALAGHEVNAINDIYIDDEIITLDSNGNCTSPSKYANKIRIKKHLGTDDQLADSDLVAEASEWTSDHRARGIAYIYVRFKYDADSFPNGVPTVTAIVQGKKVYNPDTGLTEYSSNPALCLRDYLITSGIAEPFEIDDARFAAAAAICDESVNLQAGGTELRYTCNGTFTSDTAPQSAIEDILASMGGMVWYSTGVWGCKAAAYSSNLVEFTEDDLRGTLNISTRNSRRDAFNSVSGIYRGEETNYFDTSFPTVSSTSFVNIDGGLESELEMNLPFTNTSTMAQRIAKIALYRNREQLKVKGAFGMRAMQCQVGDIIQLTNSRLGFESKDFEVVEWSFGIGSEMALEIQMTLQEISSAVFEPYANEAVFESNNTTLLSPFYVPNIALALSQEYRAINETVTNVLVVDVTSDNDDFVDYVEVQFKKSTDSDYSVLGIGNIGRFEVLNIDTPLVGDTTEITYNVRSRAYNNLGVKGTFTNKSKIIEADTTPPATPSNFQHILSAGSIFFTWDANTELDLSYYALYHSPSTTATFGDGTATQIIAKIARPATSVSYPALSGTFFLEAYDKSGNASPSAASSVQPSELPTLGASQTDTEDPTFAGTDTNTTTISSDLLLDSYSTAPSTGTYEFDGYLDVTTSRTVRVSYGITQTRSHANAVSGEVNWDDIPKNWDSWPGNWDDWTDETTSFLDFSTVVYVMATDVDAGGATPDWTGKAWTVATGEATGRWFKFKAVLSSDTDNVTPLITALSGTVEY